MAIANLCITAELGAVENRALGGVGGGIDSKVYTLDTVVRGLLEDPSLPYNHLTTNDCISSSYDINYFIEKFGLRWPDVRFLLQRWGHGVVLEAMRQMASTGAVPRRRGAYLAGICRRLGTEQLSQTPELHTRDNTNSCIAEEKP